MGPWVIAPRGWPDHLGTVGDGLLRALFLFGPIVGKNEKDVENAKGNCRQRKDVDRDELSAMIF